MADGTRLSQLSESFKECQEALLQQQYTTTTFQHQQNTHNTNFQQQQHQFQQQLMEVSDLLRTLVTNQPRPLLNVLSFLTPPSTHPLLFFRAPRLTLAFLVVMVVSTHAMLEMRIAFWIIQGGIIKRTRFLLMTTVRSICQGSAYSTPDLCVLISLALTVYI
jgi:hypothetical protein